MSRKLLLIFAVAVCFLAYSTVLVSANQKCSVCKFLVSSVQENIHKYEDKIDGAFKKAVCTKFGAFEPVCDRFVDKYGPKVIDALVQKINPDVVCSKFGFCTSNEWIRSLMTEEEAVEFYITALAQSDEDAINGGAVQCHLCEFAATQAQNLIKKTDPSQILDVLAKQCSRLPSKYDGLCETVVFVYGPKIVEYITTVPAELVCQKVGLCPKMASPAFIEPPVSDAPIAEFESAASPNCPLCKYVVTELVKHISSNATEEKIIKSLERVCSALPAKWAKPCTDLVEQNLPDLIYYLINKYPADKICTYIGMCTSDKNEEPIIVEPITEEANNVQCPLCEFVMERLIKELGSNRTEEKIKQTLGKVCNSLPDRFTPQCNLIVEMYLPVLIEYVQQKYTPKEICTKLGLCDKAAFDVVVPVPDADNGIPTCPLCMMAIQELEKIIAAPATEKKIVAALEKVCTRLPGNFQKQCGVLVENFAPVIIQKLLEKATPSAVCSFIRACQKTQVEETVAVPRDILEQLVTGNGQYCAMCLRIAVMVEESLASNRTRESIAQALVKVCDKLSAEWTGKCKIIVPLFLDKLIDLFLEKEKPSVICRQLKFCDPAVSTCNQVALPLEAFNNAQICSGCKSLVAYAGNYITKDSTVEKIKAALEKSCDKFPARYSSLCKTVVQAYGDKIVAQLVDKVLQPEKVCSAVRACPKSL